MQKEEVGDATMITIRHFPCDDAVRASWKSTARRSGDHRTRSKPPVIVRVFDHLFLLDNSCLGFPPQVIVLPQLPLIVTDLHVSICFLNHLNVLTEAACRHFPHAPFLSDNWPEMSVCTFSCIQFIIS